MFERNGIVYTSAPERTANDELKVMDARVTGDWTLLVRFSNGETRVVDGTRLFDQPAYKPLESLDVFNALNVDHGVLTWQDGAVDIGGDVLYAMSYEYDARHLISA